MREDRTPCKPRRLPMSESRETREQMGNDVVKTDVGQFGKGCLIVLCVVLAIALTIPALFIFALIIAGIVGQGG